MTLSMQEYFDKTVNYLRQQKEQSYGKYVDQDGCATEGCLYKTSDENKCAVGLHIPDEYIDVISDGLSIINISEKYPQLRGIAWPIDLKGIDLANQLQNLHDGNHNRANDKLGGLSLAGERKAKNIAREFNLTYTEPTS